MALNDLASVATIIEAVFVILSVGFIWREVRENTRLTRAANTQALVELSSPFNLQLIQDREIARFWVRGTEDFGDMDEVDRYRYVSMLIWWLILHENIYYQWRKGLLDDDSYNPWARDLETFVRTKNVGLHWDELQGGFQIEFAGHVRHLIEKSGEPMSAG